jgi:hypothetical protein
MAGSEDADRAAQCKQDV